MQPPSFSVQLLALLAVCVFALLVCYAAACFTGWLTGSLAFAAAAVFCVFAQITSFQCLNMFFHDYPPIKSLISILYRIAVQKSIHLFCRFRNIVGKIKVCVYSYRLALMARWACPLPLIVKYRFILAQLSINCNAKGLLFVVKMNTQWRAKRWKNAKAVWHSFFFGLW